jgi:DNA gyrase inhibitor GyrI
MRAASRPLQTSHAASSSATAFRARQFAELEALSGDAAQRSRLQRLPEGENPDGFEAQISQLPARMVAYIRESDPYRAGIVEGAAQRLIAWAEARGFADGQWLGYMWDAPSIAALDLELRTLDWLYGTWLPRSRYVPDDQLCFEAWIGRPFQHGPEHFELLLQLPVKPDHLWGRG